MKKFLIIAGSVFCIYGIIILGILWFYGLFNYFFLCLGLLTLALGLSWDKFSKKSKKVITGLIIALSLVFCCVEGVIISHAVKQPVKNADYIMILGCKVNANGPSVDFRARIEATYRYLIDNPETMVIATGGQGSDERMSEALCAKNYLIDKGISEDRILMEDKSTNTVENLRFTREILENRGEDVEECSVVISSASYHLCRAEFIAGKQGYGNVYGIGSNGLVILMPHYYTREFFAFVKDFVVLSLG